MEILTTDNGLAAQPDPKYYVHTRRTIQMESGTSEKTVRRWIKKANEMADIVPLLKGGVEHFTDSQRDLIISYQSKSKQPEVVEAELMPEPGAITLSTSLHQATGLMRFDIEPIELEKPVADLTAIEQQTAQLEQVKQQGANAIAAYFRARVDLKMAEASAAIDNFVEGIQAEALSGVARSLSQQQAQQRGKP